jgi:hypothetical protein
MCTTELINDNMAHHLDNLTDKPFRPQDNLYRRSIMARPKKVILEEVTFEEALQEEATLEENEATNDEATIAEIKHAIALLEFKLIELRAKLPVEPKIHKKAINKGVGDLIRGYIQDGLTNTEILPKVHAHYGNTNTTYACVAWYRNKM